MRTPSTPEQRWDWWERAITGEAVPVHERDPHAGFFRVRKFAYGKWPTGPWLPARVWWEAGEIDPETGELLSDERCRAQIDNEEVNPWTSWTWIARRPISEAEWKWLRAQSPLLPSKIPAKVARR